MAIHSSILAWRTPWTEEPGGLQSWGYKELDMTEQLKHTHYNQNYSSNPRTEMIMIEQLLGRKKEKVSSTDQVHATQKLKPKLEPSI